MELLDIVDENNQITGKIEERKIIHDKCLWHRHVSCWIMNERGELLFQKRSQSKKRNPNKWGKTGGHVDAGEDVETAMLREIKEEIGIDIDKKNLELLSIYKSKDLKNKYFGYYFFTKVNYLLEDYILQDEEVSDVKYITIEEMEKIKENNNESYTFVKWENERFYEEIEMLKRKRNEQE